MRPDGCLVVTGRNDFRVKIRGFRIEVAEIELALRGLTEIKEAAVVAHEDQSGEKQLVAYVVSEPEQVPSTSELRGFLKDKLPDYMVPAAYVFLDALPLTPNGKLDRRALPARIRAKPRGGQRIRGATHAGRGGRVAGIWADVLGVERVGVHDNFFELGGHSLLATQVISRMREAFEVELPLRASSRRPPWPPSPSASRRPAEVRRAWRPPSSPVARSPAAALLRAAAPVVPRPARARQPSYNIARRRATQWQLDVRPWSGASTSSCRHEALRTTFAAAEGEPFQVDLAHHRRSCPLKT